METIKNVTQLLFAADQTPTASLEGNTINALADLADGEIVVTDEKNLVFDAASLPTIVPAFKLIQRSGGVLIHSDVVKQGQVGSYDIGLQSAEVQQVDYVGSNGTAGALDEIASNIYTIRLYIQGSTITDFMQQKIKEGFWKSNTAAATYTQEAVATGLYDSLIANFSREAEEEIAFGRINSGARTNLGTATTSLTFTKGSKTVSCAGTIEDATGGTLLIVGEWIGGAVAVTQPLYKIVSIDIPTDTLVLDRPYREATATVLDDAVGRVIIATALAGDYGVKLLGLDRAFQAGFFKSAVVQWKTTIDFGDNQTTTVDESVAAYPGVGTYQQVASLEKELQADNHVYRAMADSGVIDRSDAVSGSLYDLTIVEFGNSVETGLGAGVNSPKTLEVALEANTDQADDANSGIITTLNAIIVTKWATPGASAQTPTA